jgi:hypothetical protein
LTSMVPVLGSNSVTFTAYVGSAQGGIPTGMVTFWDGGGFLSQIALSSGRASISTTNLQAGSHHVWAEYASDTAYTYCTGAVAGISAPINQVAVLADGTFQIAFTNASGAPFTMVGSPDVTLPASNWIVLGPVTEVVPGQFQFSDPQATTRSTSYFYRVRSP